MRSPFHSIRWQVQVWHGVILLLAVVAFCVTAYRLAWNNQVRRIDRDLLELERVLVGGLIRASEEALPPDAAAGGLKEPPPVKIAAFLRQPGATLPAEVGARFGGGQPGHRFFKLETAGGEVRFESENAPPDLAMLPIPREGFAEEIAPAGDRRRILSRSGHGLGIVVGRDITPELEEMRGFAWSLGFSGLGVWLLGLLGGWWLAGRAIHPIQTISRTAARIAAGNLRERISPSGTHDELDELGRVLNDTFERLHAAFEQQRQFTADASHELRTPVTILLSETRRMLKRNHARSPEEYLEVIRTCHEAAQRMRLLIEALLQLAHEERPAPRGVHETCDLAAVLRDTAGHLGALASERNIRLHPELQSAPCEGDPTSLSVLASNLVSNAIHHNRDAGNVWIATRLDGDHAILTVRDDGPGIPSEDLPHIFQRFYRADKARTGATGHSGLGLAIARTIVENHGGVITAESPPDGGATFTVRLPAGHALPAAASGLPSARFVTRFKPS